MDKKVYIVHGSAIIQDGLADILRKNFKCTIQCYPDINTLLQSENTPISKGIFFIEDIITDSKEYLQFLHKSHGLKSFSIKNSKPEKILSQSQNTLFLYESPDKIHNQVKHLFNDPKQIENEPDELTKREIDVLKLVALGYSNKEIADKLFVSIHTVMSHRKNMTQKLGIKSISGLTVYAIINNYIDTTNLDLKDLI